MTKDRLLILCCLTPLFVFVRRIFSAEYADRLCIAHTPIMLIGMSAFANRGDDAAHGFCTIIWLSIARAIAFALSSLREMRYTLASLITSLPQQHTIRQLCAQNGLFAAVFQWFSFGNRQGGAPPWSQHSDDLFAFVNRSKRSSMPVHGWSSKLGAIFIFANPAFAFHKQTPKVRSGVLK